MSIRAKAALHSIVDFFFKEFEWSYGVHQQLLKSLRVLPAVDK